MSKTGNITSSLYEVLFESGDLQMEWLEDKITSNHKKQIVDHQQEALLGCCNQQPYSTRGKERFQIPHAAVHPNNFSED